MKNKKENINDSSTELTSQMRGVLANPQKFYYLLILSGLSASKAQSLMFDLKYPKLRLASPSARKKVIKLLTTLIDTITKDNMLYSRFRSLAGHGLFEQEGGMTTASGIPGMGYPSAQADPPFGSIPGLFKFIKKHAKSKNKLDPVILTNNVMRRR
jgi:hypothetical protein